MSRRDDDLQREIRQHLTLEAAERVNEGLSPAAARTAAVRAFGNVMLTREDARAVWIRPWIDALLQDVRYALRLFRRAPGFTAVAVLTLALGIGANAAIFGVVKSVMLDALPYADASRLMRVYGRFTDGAPGRPSFSAAVVRIVSDGQHAFESMAAFDSSRDVVYGGNDGARIATVAWVEPHLFRTLGIQPVIGRNFERDDRAIGYVPASGAEIGSDTARVVMLAYATWQRLFSGDAGIVGRDVRLNGILRTVIGVLPRDVVGPMGPADFYLAFDLEPALASGAGWLGLVGRLKPGITPEAAQRDIAAVWASRENAKLFGNVDLSLVTLRDAMLGNGRTALLMLLVSAALVLAIACANLSAVQLSRGLARRRELAVRVALGAGRRRIVRQLLTESLVLALAGGVAGLVLAQVLLAGARAMAGALLPSYTEWSLDSGAVIVTAAIAVCAGVAFGVMPALVVGRADPHDTLRDVTRGSSEGRHPRRLRGLLVAGQIALCTTLLAGAGLLARSLWQMSTVPLGFDARGVLTARFRLSTVDYPTLDRRTRFHEQLVERLRRVPGVDEVAIANKVPTVDPRRASFSTGGIASNAVEGQVLYASVSDDYFRTLRITLRRGRTFDSSDQANGPGTAVISESLARRYWPTGDALGARIRLDGDILQVVGIAGDVRSDLARLASDPIAYRSHRQESTQRLAIMLRTQGEPLALVRSVEQVVAGLDRALPVQQAMTLEEAIGAGLAGRRLPVLLMALFGALSLLLASVGVHGMFASMAAARAREFGIRMALGSRRRTIAGLILQQGGVWMAAGLVGGAIGAFFVTRLLATFVEAMPQFDPIALGLAAVTMVVCATTALVIPLRRAMRADPMLALRDT